MFRISLIAALVCSTPAVAMDHATCVKLQVEAYEAKDALWKTSQALRNARVQGAEEKDAAKLAQEEAMSARFSVNDYIQRLSDFCESLR